MRKNILVFCCVTLLTALFFGCNGVPALAAPVKSKADLIGLKKENTSIKKATERTIAKKKDGKKRSKKKSKKAIKIEDYIKGGKFDYESYGNAVGAISTEYYTTNINLVFNDYFLTLSTDKQEKKEKGRYLIAIGYISNDYVESEITFFDIKDSWKKSIKIEKDISVSSNGLKDLHRTVLYMAKNHDPYKKPEIKGIDWKEGKDFDKYNGK